MWQRRVLPRLAPWCAFVLLVAATQAASAASGPYFGQAPPGPTPEVFAPGILSLASRAESRIDFAPGGEECFFGVTTSGFTYQRLYTTSVVDGSWSSQRTAPFSGTDYNMEPFYSADGNQLYFTSYAGAGLQRDLYVVERDGDGWGTPIALPSPINTPTTNEWTFSAAPDGTIYFSSNRSGGYGGTDFWRTSQAPGDPIEVENLGPLVNSSSYEWSPIVSANGKYFLFSSERSGGEGLSDLYYSVRGEDGQWGAPHNMNEIGSGYNSRYWEYGLSFSPDGKYLFFVRHNGTTSDVYWVANPFVPEPATGALLFVGGLALVGVVRRRLRQ